jgi:hypothetical protein
MRDRKQEREMLKIAEALYLEKSSSTLEGAKERKRLERRIQKIVQNDRSFSRWERVRANIKLNFEELSKELDAEIFVFGRQKKERKA